MINSEISLGRFLKIILVLITLAITFFVVDSLSNVLLPFFVAWLIAYLLYPLVRFFQYRLRFKYRMLSIVAALVLVLTLLVGVFMLIVPSMVAEFASFKSVAISFFGQQVKNPTIPPLIAEYVRELGNEQGVMQLLQSDGIQDLLMHAWSRLQHVLLGTINIAAQLAASFIVLLYIFFILLDYEMLADEWKQVLPLKWRRFATRLSDDLTDGMSQYFRGQALVALCVGVLFAIGFLIIDFPIAIGFGLFIGVLNLVPYLQIVSLVPMTLLALMKAANTGDNFWVILFSALAVLCVVQTIQDLFLVPRIMGKRMNLHPAVILLSLSIWGSLLGMLGMIIALPFTTLLIGYVKRYHSLHTDSSREENGASDSSFSSVDGNMEEN
ncbi:MAG: AI-2E family transporter [Bacteroidaceae bacterium]|nr:AI-2E family transporter [Bacteroidaceae bacterium]